MGLDPANQILDPLELATSGPTSMFEQLGRGGSGPDLTRGELDIFMNEGLDDIAFDRARGRESAFQFDSFEDLVNQIVERGPGAATGETIPRQAARGNAAVGGDIPSSIRTSRVPGQRSAFRTGARAAGRALGPLSSALFAGMDANRFNQNPTRETARSIAEEVGNPAMSIGRALGLDEATASQLPRSAGGVNAGDLVPVTNAIADFLFRGLSQQRESRAGRDTTPGPRQSPTGS
jgi:hypothetical protein